MGTPAKILLSPPVSGWGWLRGISAVLGWLDFWGVVAPSVGRDGAMDRPLNNLDAEFERMRASFSSDALVAQDEINRRRREIEARGDAAARARRLYDLHRWRELHGVRPTGGRDARGFLRWRVPAYSAPA